jgi:hypothetical protein
MSEGNARAAAIVIVLGVLVFGAGAGCLGVLSRIADDVESIAKATATTDTTTTTAPTTTTAVVNQAALARAMMDGPHVSSESDAECWASALIADIGPDRMAEVGLTPDVFKGWGFPSGARLSEVHRNAFASAYERCIDYAFERRVGQFTPNIVALCMDRDITPEMERAYALELLGDIDTTSGLHEIGPACAEEYWASVRNGEG